MSAVHHLHEAPVPVEADLTPPFGVHRVLGLHPLPGSSVPHRIDVSYPPRNRRWSDIPGRGQHVFNLRPLGCGDSTEHCADPAAPSTVGEDGRSTCGGRSSLFENAAGAVSYREGVDGGVPFRSSPAASSRPIVLQRAGGPLWDWVNDPELT